ncbi:DUF2165 family protein [Segnochrobactrum spirostomi]|uniref:DUF2165 domain-containing protein n=1 Tax=Segnochrobactrum spirostomi TaxID=2608987 RepID=A0A6A7Y8R3_9HYPH|nr:DUF2165 domain-containing protein [Segnochrobactrum spirostomi]MQT14368.1 DUF2165 domain-containing protein [Segnochrobactrum spirostomi]
MLVARVSKTALVAAIALYVTLVAVGNVVDYGTNYAFVQHVLMMDTIFQTSQIAGRSINVPLVHRIAYGLIIALEWAVAIICWVGAVVMALRLRRPAVVFQRAKAWAIAGLTLGVILWAVGFLAIGGEWFGMWMSSVWNGVQPAFRIALLILAVLIYVSLPEPEIG